MYDVDRTGSLDLKELQHCVAPLALAAKPQFTSPRERRAPESGRKSPLGAEKAGVAEETAAAGMIDYRKLLGEETSAVRDERARARHARVGACGGRLWLCARAPYTRCVRASLSASLCFSVCERAREELCIATRARCAVWPTTHPWV